MFCINFIYKENIQNKELEERAIVFSIERWLRLFEHEIQKQSGVVNIVFFSPHKQIFNITNVTDELKSRIREHINNMFSFSPFRHL